MKERDKIEKYGDLKRRVAATWDIKKIIFVPVVIDALGAVSKEFDKWMEKIRVNLRVRHVQKNCIIRMRSNIEEDNGKDRLGKLYLLVAACFQSINRNTSYPRIQS